MTFDDVTFHEDSPFFSSPLLSLTPPTTSPPLNFPSLVVIANPYPSIPSPPISLSSPSPPISSILHVSSILDVDPITPHSTTTFLDV